MGDGPLVQELENDQNVQDSRCTCWHCGREDDDCGRCQLGGRDGMRAVSDGCG